MKPIIAQIGNLAAKKKAHYLRARDSVRRASDFVQIAITLTILKNDPSTVDVLSKLTRRTSWQEPETARRAAPVLF